MSLKYRIEPFVFSDEPSADLGLCSMPITGFVSGSLGGTYPYSRYSYELREDGSHELREDGGYELRE